MRSPRPVKGAAKAGGRPISLRQAMTTSVVMLLTMGIAERICYGLVAPLIDSVRAAHPGRTVLVGDAAGPNRRFKTQTRSGHAYAMTLPDANACGRFSAFRRVANGKRNPRRVRDACVRQAVPYFFKQWGQIRNNPDPNDPTAFNKGSTELAIDLVIKEHDMVKGKKSIIITFFPVVVSSLFSCFTQE